MADSLIVQRGDNLWSIARRYGTTVEALVRLNPRIKNPNLILRGSKLLLPDNISGTVAPVQSASGYFAKAVRAVEAVPGKMHDLVVGHPADASSSVMHDHLAKPVRSKSVNLSEKKARFQEVASLAAKAGDPHPEIVAAQWALESGFGKTASGENNLFGIKARPGDGFSSTPVATHEVVHGKSVPMIQNFRNYASKLGSITDRVAFTQKNPIYRKAGYFEASTPLEAANALHKAGYATDPAYASKLTSIIRSMGGDVNAPSGTSYSA